MGYLFDGGYTRSRDQFSVQHYILYNGTWSYVAFGIYRIWSGTNYRTILVLSSNGYMALWCIRII